MKKLKKAVKYILCAFTLLLAAVLVLQLTTPFEKSIYAENTAGGRQIALTFDDGPGKYTEELLEGLRERNVKVSFFLMGSKAEKHPELVEAMYSDGHLVGNHTYSHISFFKSSGDEIAEELAETSDIIESITGERPIFFRPPYGYYTGLMLNRIDMIAVLWSETPRDWEISDEDMICERIVSEARDGQIILLHDTKEGTVPAVLRAIDILMSEGYEFVRVDELLCRNGDYLAAGLAYRFCADGERPRYF
ncbi:MAG: polysaccharide deacetylase family protein [Oscillospiraceae bacterium]|nr:polysaccharide deacetylase family protein [Oscillospiraceae bacterium]